MVHMRYIGKYCGSNTGNRLSIGDSIEYRTYEDSKLNTLRNLAIIAVSVAVLSVLVHGNVFGKQCTFYEDGSNDCNKKINKNQWDCSTMGNKICGNNNNNDNDNDKVKHNDNDNHKKHTSQNELDYNEDKAISNYQKNAMYEDQYKICNFEDVCTVVNIDDSLGEEMQKELAYRFNHNLDTFTQVQALDEECRDNYHSFCFGEAWNSLEEFLN